jgi:hypothetical protein
MEMNPSEETDRLARDASLPIIADQITQSEIIDDFGKYLDDTAPDISNNKEDNNVNKE